MTKVVNFLLLTLNLINYSHTISTGVTSKSSINNKKVGNDTDIKKFQAWKLKYHKNYQSKVDEEMAMKKVLANEKEIAAHNELYKAGKVSYMIGTWENSDLNYTEKLDLITGEREDNSTSQLLMRAVRMNFPKGPDSIDWRDAGLVHPVIDQSMKNLFLKSI
jgi:hypothetical protein